MRRRASLSYWQSQLLQVQALLAALDLAEASAQMQTDALIAGVLTFISAFATMAFLMNFLKKASMLVFVIYRVAMGVALLVLF